MLDGYGISDQWKDFFCNTWKLTAIESHEGMFTIPKINIVWLFKKNWRSCWPGKHQKFEVGGSLAKERPRKHVMTY